MRNLHILYFALFFRAMLPDVAIADWSAQTVAAPATPDIHWQSNETIVNGKRTGLTPDNFKYTIEQDGSGDIQMNADDRVYDPDAPDWHFECPVDSMTDKRNCVVRNGYYGFVIGFTAHTPSIVCLGAHDFPGKTGMIRIDKNAPISTDDRGCVAWKRTNALIKGTTVTLRYFKFPYDHPEESHYPLAGLKSAIGLTSFVYQNIDKLNF